MNYDDSTIAAVSTAQGEGGIGVIRISGSGAVETADKIFKNINGRRLRDMRGYTALFGEIVSGGEKIDDAVALVFRAPLSYTGEDVVELSCHGGIYVTKLVLRAALENGARPAQPGEFTKRAFLNGKTGLTEAEAVMDLIGAKGRGAARAAAAQLDGALGRKIGAVKGKILALTAHLGAWADYPDEDIAEVSDEEIAGVCSDCAKTLEALLDSYDGGQAVIHGIDAVIAGRPNVGKSTVMNLLAGCDRSIVTDIPGTTRDVIESTVSVGDVVLRLSDTAGLRQTDDKVEKIGVERTRRRLGECDLLIAVFDGSSELSDEDFRLIDAAGEMPSVAVINKTDLPQVIDSGAVEAAFCETVRLCALSGEGEDGLKKAIERAAGAEGLSPSGGLLSNERQRAAAAAALDSLRGALEALGAGITYDAITVLLEEAADKLAELTGERTSEEVVDRIFHNFCVGK